MLGAVLAMGFSMVTVGGFIERVEASGVERIFAVGLDRSAVLTEGDVVSIASELGVHLTTQFPRRQVDGGKVHWAVWMLSPDGQGKGKGGGNGKGKKKGHSRCSFEWEEER